MKTKLSCTASQLDAITNEAHGGNGEMVLETASALGAGLRGGIDHVQPSKDGWSLTIFDRGCNGRSNDFVFTVPKEGRTPGRGPAW